MNTLRNHVILYDAECPLCESYTKAFVSTGMLDKNGRMPFSEACAVDTAQLDTQRAKDEIALVNRETGEVTYGIESLFKVVANSFPCANSLFRWPVFMNAMKVFYAFISYNRKVIVPGSIFEKNSVCAPSYHAGYRIAYLIVTWILTSIVLTMYARLLAPVVPATSFGREFMICGGQLVFQLVAIAFLDRTKWLYYLGNMMTVSTIGALLLLPLLLISSMTHILPHIALGWFFLVVLFMLIDHHRRVHVLQASSLLSVSWVAYRILILLIIL